MDVDEDDEVSRPGRILARYGFVYEMTGKEVERLIHDI
jgi:hypothetical protein